MKTSGVFLLIVLAVTLYASFWFFGQIYQVYDANALQTERSNFQSVGKNVDSFLSSKAGIVLEKLDISFLKNQKAKLLHQKAVALYRSGSKESEQVFSEAQTSAVNPRVKADIIFNSTEGKVIKGDTESAIAAYQENLKLNPEDWQAKNNLEMLLQQQEGSGKGKDKDGKDKGKLDNQKGGGGNKRSKMFDLELFQQIPKGTKKVDK
ncbi:MAG: hypothetical protein HYX21_03050 [Candidatus Yanofskybacteria bacterium]|nr:hypothetical protein [Candidatus Yanofskybacteria bacterium]